MSARRHKRPWLAAVLAFLQPGLGHLYLRAWVRAALWFGLWVTTVLMVAPVPEAGGPVQAVLQTTAALSGLSFEATLALLSVTAFSMLDAYWLAARGRDDDRTDDASQCPNCGKEVEVDLEFCHWCTEPLGER